MRTKQEKFKLAVKRVAGCGATRGWYHKWHCNDAPAFVLSQNGKLTFLCTEHGQEALAHHNEGEVLTRIV